MVRFMLFQEAQELINKSISVAKKLPDIGIQLWATALLKDLANLRGMAEEERHWFAEHDQFSKMVINDHMLANGSPEHALIYVGQPTNNFVLFLFVLMVHAML